MRTVVVIGGGASGFFAAANLLELFPNVHVIILEKTTKLLSKVRISGGGRCNVTHDCSQVADLIQYYPRGARPLKHVFHQFGVADTKAWFESRGVELKTERDGRVFPISDSSQSIISCLMDSCSAKNVSVRTSCEVVGIEGSLGNFIVVTKSEKISCSAILVAAGGFSKPEGYQFLQSSGHRIVPPVPSLFTLNLKEHPLVKLMGISVSNAEVRVVGTKYRYRGPVLITHWGFSGPAVLKLSAFAAELFHERNYLAEIAINWTSSENEEQIREKFLKIIRQKSNSFPANTDIFELPRRLWEYILNDSGILLSKNWSEQSAKSINRMVSKLGSDIYTMSGKTTFKEEFVTCGGIDLDEVEMRTMESKRIPGLFFSGEVLNIDGVTGGFNFQAAWSTAYVASKSIAEKLKNMN
jgi:predicted Rossmann fold flavoprotein